MFLNSEIRNIESEDYNDVKILLKEGTDYHINLDNNFKKMVEENIEYFNNELEETIKSKNNSEILIYKISFKNISKVIGILVYNFEDEDTIYISDLYIELQYRTNGFATRLLDELTNRYPKKKIKLICLVKNTLAYNFYIKYGFKIIETLKGKKYKINSYIMGYNM